MHGALPSACCDAVARPRVARPQVLAPSMRCARTLQSRCQAAFGSNGSSPSTTSLSGSQRMAETGGTAAGTSLVSKALDTLTARDMMTSPPWTLRAETSVMDAMQFLVQKGISGVPVVSPSGNVLGVCSGYDLLALDSTPGKLDKSFFPPIDTCINEFGGDRKMMWSTFKELRSKLRAANGSTVEEVMHRAFTIRPDASMEEAATLVVQKRAHRICVVDDDGVLLGMVSRGDIMRATIANFQAYMDHRDRREADES